MRVRRRTRDDESRVNAFLEHHGAARVARLGELLHAADYPALIAEEYGRLAGVLTYIIAGSQCEILTIHSARQWQGTGTVLIDAVERLARDEGCARLFLITTNDNVDALRFYQRRGFRFASLHPGAVDDSRARLKPEIPETGAHGIPLRDELVLEKDV
jgi:GNAT superfamily N-acetyltransferase